MRARVLVVHDVTAVRTLVSQALESEGCTAIGVEDCGTAAGLAALDPPDVIVADERIIAKDPEAFRIMREQFPKVVVVALVAPLRRQVQTAWSGVDCSIEKPPRDEQLLRAIQWALGLAQPERSDDPRA